MRRIRRSSKSDVIIDLTSLLDVVFIILLVVLYGSNTRAANLSETQSKAEEAISQAEEEKRLYEEQQEAFSNIWAVSVIVPYDENEITKRHICILEKGEEIKSIDLVGNDTANARDEFKNYLVDYIKKNEDKPIMLSLNDDDKYILYRDEVMVNNIFDELIKTYRNVYVIKGSVSEEIK